MEFRMSAQTPQTDFLGNCLACGKGKPFYPCPQGCGAEEEIAHYKALCEELKGALMKMTGWADYLNDCDSWYAQQQPGNGITEDIAEARAALKKAQKDI